MFFRQESNVSLLNNSIFQCRNNQNDGDGEEAALLETFQMISRGMNNFGCGNFSLKKKVQI